MEWLESRAVRPRQARYQAALRPDMKCHTYSRAVRGKAVSSTIPTISPLGGGTVSRHSR